MFGSRRVEAALAALQAENSDLRQQLRLERAQAAANLQTLLDRLLAATNPSALREVRRTPDRGPVQAPDQRRRLNYPGSTAPSLRPPSPPSHPVPGSVPLTDQQIASVLSTSDSYTAAPQEYRLADPQPVDKAI